MQRKIPPMTGIISCDQRKELDISAVVAQLYLNASINAEKDMLARCRNALKGLPRGGLTSYLRNGRLYYKRNEAGEQKYLGTESNPMVNKLKKRHLLEKMIDILENNIPNSQPL